MKAYGLLAVVGILLASGVWWLVSNEASDITNYPPKNNTIVAFGDSLVFGYGSTPGNDFVSGLSRKLGRPIENLGVSGNTTADGLLRADEVIDRDPGVVILLLGGNDYLRRITADTTKANLTSLITTFQKEGAVVVLLGVRGGVIRDGRDSMYSELAEEYGAVYVSDVLNGIFLKPELMFDGIHPNDAGYAIIADRLYEVFRSHNL